jgi:coenzyme PQQ precursor peptide PqqA
MRRAGQPNSGFAKRSGCIGHAWPQLAEGELHMREWHKPTIEETESGMEVTSYLPAELDRA